MINRRIRKLPQRAGNQSDADAINGGSLDFVDLASQHRSEEDRKERQELARGERLQALRDARMDAVVAGETTMHEADHSVSAQADGESNSVELFEADQRERRVFSTPVQDEIATMNTRRIRWFERGGRLTAVGVVALGAVLVFAYVARTDRNVADSDGSSVLTPTEELSLDYASYLSKSKRVARKFVLADSHEERLKYVRYPGKVAELMFKDKSMDWGAPLPFEEVKTYEIPLHEPPFFLGCYVEDENERKYPIEAEVRPDGLLIDWEAFAEYNEVPWEDLLDERSTLRDYSLRVVASLDDYYNYQFTEDKYTCFHIQNRDRTLGMYAYAPKKGWVESELRKLLTERLMTQGAGVAMTSLIQIKIRFQEQETPRPMAEITSYLAPHWFTIPPGEDERSMVNPRAMVGGGSDDGVPLKPTTSGAEELPLAPKGSWR